MSPVTRTILDEYKVAENLYNDFCILMHDILNTMLKKGKYKYQISNRLKDITSLEEKIKRKRNNGTKYEHLEDIEDLAGIRVIFYTEIDKYAIKVGKKDKDGEKIENVLIYEQTNPLQENTIIAKGGKMAVSADNRYLEFNLTEGNRYQEKGNYGDTATEYVRLQFRTFKKLFDLSAFNQKGGNEEDLKNNSRMLSAVQLNKNIDSLTKYKDSLSRTQITTIRQSLMYVNDTSAKWKKIAPVKFGKNEKLFPDSATDLLYDRSITKISEMKNIMFFNSTEAERKRLDILNFKLEWQRKFAFSLACMVLFFIGAPLGSIIRKGGLGMPLIVAIIFFLIFHLLTMFGEKFVKTEVLSPFLGMWLAIIVLTPVGIFFTYKAMNDSQLFNKDLYLNFYRKTTSLFKKKNNG